MGRFSLCGSFFLGNTSEVTAHLKHSLSSLFLTLMIAFLLAKNFGSGIYELPDVGVYGSMFILKDSTSSNCQPELWF